MKMVSTKIVEAMPADSQAIKMTSPCAYSRPCTAEGRSLGAPSNGAGFGPVTIDKFSSSLTRRRRDVFFTRSSYMVSGPTLRSRAAIMASYSVMGANWLGSVLLS